MICDMNYCIYNNELVCILEEVAIGSNGMCEECILVNIEEDALFYLKQGHLEKLNYNKIKKHMVNKINVYHMFFNSFQYL